MAGRSRTNVPATIYKDFQPQIDRKEEQGANILAIHLPDFPKEQLIVIYVDASRTIKVQAEKALEKNTRSRFNQDFPVPENCIIEKIQASFRNGILTITMPKRITTQQIPLDSPKQITPTAASSSTSAVQKQRDQKLQSPPKPKTHPKPPTTTAPKPTAEPKPPVATPTAPKPISEPRPPMAKPITEPKPPMATPMVPKPTSEPRPPMAAVAKPTTEPKPPMVTAPQIPKQQTKGKEVEALPPLKQQEEIQRKVSAIAKQTEEEKAGGPTLTPEIVERNGETKDGLKDLGDGKAKNSVPQAANIPKASVKADGVERMPKGGGFLEMTSMDTIMKTVKRLATDDAEDRQLLINIGVSVLVIVALGAYITYSYRSSGKAKN